MTETATLAGGCFWGVEELIRKLPGVVDTTVGYTGGTLAKPRYEDVKSGKTGHAESLEIKFDPERISYEEILRYFFRLHDPTTPNRQGNDVGTQYRSAIFVHDAKQRETAERVKNDVNASGKWPRPVMTEIVDATDFWPAEEYHQDYLQKYPNGYTCHYLRYPPPSPRRAGRGWRGAPGEGTCNERRATPSSALRLASLAQGTFSPVRGGEGEQIATHRDRTGAWLHAPVRRLQQIEHRLFIELRGVPHVLVLVEREVLREHRDRPLDAIARHAAQLDQIVGAGDRDDQLSVVAQHAAELRGIQPRGDGGDDPEGRICVWQEAIGIGDDPVTRRIALRRRVDRRDGDVDAVPLLRIERAEVIALAAAGIENRTVERLHEIDDGVEQRPRESAIEKPPPRRDRLRRIARHPRAPILRLQQIEVTAARDVEGMSALADRAALLDDERRVAIADGAEEGDHPTIYTCGAVVWPFSWGH